MSDKGLALEAVLIEITEVGEPKLKVISVEPMRAAYQAKAPGQARIDVALVDRGANEAGADGHDRRRAGPVSRRDPRSR